MTTLYGHDGSLLKPSEFETIKRNYKLAVLALAAIAIASPIAVQETIKRNYKTIVIIIILKL